MIVCTTLLCDYRIQRVNGNRNHNGAMSMKSAARVKCGPCTTILIGTLDTSWARRAVSIGIAILC